MCLQEALLLTCRLKLPVLVASNYGVECLIELDFEYFGELRGNSAPVTQDTKNELFLQFADFVMRTD